MDYSMDGTPVEVVPGVKVYTPTRIRVSDYRGYDLTLTTTVNDGRAEVDSMAIERRPGSPPITGEVLRGIPVHGFIRRYVKAQVEMLNPNISEGDAVSGGGLLLTSEARRLKAAGPTPETLEAVSRIYQLADFLGDAPTKAVESTFEVSRSTAGSWIGRARAAGLLPPAGGASR